MTKAQDSKLVTAKETIAALTAVRDSARLKLHLLTLEARQQWKGLEQQLNQLQAKLETGGDKASEGTVKKGRELIRSVKGFLNEHASASELAPPVRQMMQRAVRTCSPDDGLTEAARQMWEADCGAIPVIRDGGRLAGMITDRDVCMAAYTRGRPLSEISVESTMSHDLVAASPDDSLERVLQLMRRHQVRRIPVVEQDRLVGILSLADVARFVESDSGFSTARALELARTLAEISEQRGRGRRQESAAE